MLILPHRLEFLAGCLRAFQEPLDVTAAGEEQLLSLRLGQLAHAFEGVQLQRQPRFKFFDWRAGTRITENPLIELLRRHIEVQILGRFHRFFHRSVPIVLPPSHEPRASAISTEANNREFDRPRITRAFPPYLRGRQSPRSSTSEPPCQSIHK